MLGINNTKTWSSTTSIRLIHHPVYPCGMYDKWNSAQEGGAGNVVTRVVRRFTIRRESQFMVDRQEQRNYMQGRSSRSKLLVTAASTFYNAQVNSYWSSLRLSTLCRFLLLFCMQLIERGLKGNGKARAFVNGYLTLSTIRILRVPQI